MIHIGRRQFLGVVAVTTIPVVSGCSSSSGGNNGPEIVSTTAVSMSGSQFDPRNIEVDAGATVTWTNDDGHPHTVTSATDNWSKGTEVAGGETTTHTFDDSGVYDVYCRFHGSADLSGMSMKVGVGDATIEEPLGGGQKEGGPY